MRHNFVRLHQEPATPYMLDVCDEMGLMLMEESAIRGSNDDQDFVKGHDHMVNHVKALFARDRNHPSIVRQSLGNDPDWSSTDSVQFQTDLYNAAMDVDGTRPLSIDSATQTYESMNYPNFSVYRHFGIGRQFGQYTEEVFARPDRPYGEGAFIGNNNNTRQGFCWFATGTQAMRAQGASDIRPFSLMEAWAGIIPGVATTAMELEQAGRALFGEDNLIDPWDEPLIQRVQQAFSPVLVADVDYWESVKRSNSNGDWPAGIPVLLPGQSLVRTLRIYNDTFSGTSVDVFWELRKDTPTGTMAESGVINATVPLGYSITRDIGFTVPVVPNGTMYYLVLYAGKGGKEVFREVSGCFMVSQPTIPESKLTGRVFGSEADGSAVSGCANATDGDPDTYYECKDPDGGHVGIDLGEDHAARVGVVVFSPREGCADRMLDGVFRGSMDGLHYDTFHTITTLPTEKTVVEVNSHQAYRYLAYFGHEGSFCNIAEMDFYANNDKPLAGTPFGTFPAYAPGSEYDKASDGRVETFFDYANANGGYVGIDLGKDHAQRVRYIVYTSRFNYEWRMVGGQFRGSNDGLDWTTIHTINAVPAVANNVTVRIDTTETFRYLLYMGPDESYCNIAEISWY